MATKKAAPVKFVTAPKGRYFNLAGEDIGRYITVPNRPGSILDVAGLMKNAKRVKPNGRKKNRAA